MTVRRIVAVIGFLVLAMGVAQILRPAGYWEFWRNFAVGTTYGEPPVGLYVFGVIAILLGVFLLYVGLRRLTLLAPLIWIVGALALLTGLLMLLGPKFYRDLMYALFYHRSDVTMVGLSYVGGVVRIIIGALFLIAGFKRPPEPVAQVEQTPSTEA